MMNRARLMALLGAVVSTSAACVTPEEPTTAVDTQALGDDCDYITCGRNTKDVGNGFVDHVFFDGTSNERGQSFVSWTTADSEPITPTLTSRSLWGAVAGQWRTGPALEGSTMTLEDARGQPMYLRFVDAAFSELPNGVSVWTYRIDKRRPFSAWTPLCSLFDHTDNPIARYALVGTREVVHGYDKNVTAHDWSEGKLTLGCPNSATGKLLSLGALTTTAASGQQPTVPIMTATLRALTLSPIGQDSYTKNGVGVMFHVPSTGVDNTGESLSGGVEGLWDQHGAICFEKLRIIDPEPSWALWSETQVPPCSEIDLRRYEHLVTTHRFYGSYLAYPPPPPPPPDDILPPPAPPPGDILPP